MNFLADESCAGPVIQALREAGHDVVAIAEVARGTVDELVMRRALSKRRILISEDPLPTVLCRPQPRREAEARKPPMTAAIGFNCWVVGSACTPKFSSAVAPSR